MINVNYFIILILFWIAKLFMLYINFSLNLLLAPCASPGPVWKPWYLNVAPYILSCPLRKSLRPCRHYAMIQLGPPSHPQTSTYGHCSRTVVWTASCASAARRNWIASTRRPDRATATASSLAFTRLWMRSSTCFKYRLNVKLCSLQDILECFFFCEHK